MPRNEYDDLLDAPAPEETTPVAAAGVGNAYDELIAKQASPLFKLTTRSGLVQDPQEAARILRVQDRFKLPADLIQRNLGDLEQEMARADFDPETFRAQSPTVAKWLGEQPEHMAIAKDDLPRLARLEALIASSPRYEVTAAGGVNELSPDGKTGIAYASPQEFYSREYRGREVRRQLDEQDRHRRAAALAETFGPLANVAAGAYQSLGSTLEAVQTGPDDPSRFAGVRETTQASQDLSPGIWGDLQRGAGGLAADIPLMVAGSPLAKGAGTLLKLGRIRTLVQTAASVQPLAIREGINTGRESGVWNGLAAWGIETAIPAAFGRTGVQRALIPGVPEEVMQRRVGAARRFLTEAGLEGTEEAATEFVHAVHEVVSGINPQALDGDQLSRRLIVAGALGTAAGGVFNVPELMAGEPGQGDAPAARAPGPIGDIPSILRGLNAKQFMQGLGEVAAESKAQERSPERVERLVAALGEQGRGTIYVDPLQMATYAQGRGIDPRAFAQQVVSADDYAEAVATGAPLAIPVATYFKVLAGSEHHAAISAMAKLSPGDPSVAEAEAQREQVLTPRAAPTPEQQASARATADAVAGEVDPAAAGAQRIQDDVVEQLTAAGFRPADAQAQALLLSEGFKALAQRAGKDPFALYEPYRLRITREIPGVVQAGTTDYTDTLLDRLRKGEIPTERQVRGESLVEYLRRKGGVQDQGTELSTLGAREARKPGQRSLIQADGLTLDRAAEAAQEQGYIEEADPRALLDAIDSELRGAPVFMAGEGNPETAAIRDGLLELQDYLGRLGIDLKTADNAAVKAALKAQEAAQADEGTRSLNQQGTQVEEGDIGHLSVGAQAYLVSLPAADRAVLAPSIAYLRTHPDPTGDLGNLRMLVDFNRRKAAKASAARSYNQPAYHGSPHKFDQFTTDHMGKGEGVQAFGWGLYFASEKAVAASYRDALSRAAFPDGDPRNGIASILAARGEAGLPLIKRAYADLGAGLDAAIEEARASFAGRGRLYKVDVPEDGEYLLWDKPLSEQPEKIRVAAEALRQAYRDLNPGDNSLDGDLRGGQLYQLLTREGFSGSPKGASLDLLGAGIKGIKYLDGNSRAQGDGSYNYVIFDGADVAIRAYEQPTPGDTARGRIDIAPDRSMRISLLRNANRSTFLHEVGHLYLEVLADLATAADASPDIQAMWTDVLGWLGVENRSQIGTPQHEQWAEGFETYLMEGRAPSPALRTAFARFKAWLVGVYRRLTDMRVQLSPEIRRTFDRILATDEAIAAAEGRLGVAPTFASAADAGMTAEEFAAYRASVDQAKQAANDQLRAQVMKVFQREATKQWQEERERVREETRLEVAQRPVYQAIRALRDGVLPNGETLAVKLNKQEIVDTQGSDALWRLPGPNGKKRINPNNRGRYLVADDGISLRAAAAMFGFRDGQALYEALINAPDQAQLVEQTTDQIMAKAYPDPMLDGSIDERASLALHNDLSAEVLVAELRSLSTRSGQQAAPLELLREHARQAVARQTVRSLRPDRYQVAERSAADRVEKALAEGNNRLAFVEKQKQLLNHELYRAAQKAQDDAEAAFERFRELTGRSARERLGKAGGWEWTVTAADGTTTVVDSEDAARALVAVKGGEWERTSSYLDQIDGLLERFEFRRITNKAAARRQSLGAWIRQQEEAGQAVAISDALRDSTTIVNWKDMTVEQVRDLRDAVDAIAHMATFKNRLSAEQRERDFTDARDGLMQDLAVNVRERPPSKRSAARTGADVAVARLEGFIASHRKLSSLAQEADGGKPGGKWWNALVRPFNAAADREVEMRRAAAQAMDALWTTWRADGRTLRQVVEVPGVGPMNREERIAAALNWGNEGNRERLLTGEQWTPEQGQAVIDTLDATDWALVQGVWDHINSYWSEIRALEQRMNGVAPEKIEATPFQAKGGGTIRGGYYPASYDPERASGAARREAVKAAALYTLGKGIRASTRAGATRERTQGAGDPLRLDVDVIAQHLGEIIHDITHREPVRDANMFLRDRELSGAIRERLGQAALTQMADAVEAIAASDLAQNNVDRALRWLRNGVSIATMGFNLQSAAMQVTGIGQSMQAVGIGPFARAVRANFGNPARIGDAYELIESKSSFMRNRATTAIREVHEAANKVKGGAWRDRLNQAAYFLMTQAQRAVDGPTWMAAYENALAAEHDEATAVAMADQAVIDTQGSGMVKDLAGVQRSRVTSAFTVYYSYFSALMNRTANATARARNAGWTPEAILTLAKDYALLYSLPATMSVIIGSALKGAGDDEEKRGSLAGQIAREHLGMALGNFVLVRDVNGMLDGYGYHGPAGLRGFDALSKLIIQARQGELDAGLLKAGIELGGILGRVPVTQVIRSLEGAGILGDRVQEPDLRSVLFGPPRR